MPKSSHLLDLTYSPPSRTLDSYESTTPPKYTLGLHAPNWPTLPSKSQCHTSHSISLGLQMSTPCLNNTQAAKILLGAQLLPLPFSLPNFNQPYISSSIIYIFMNNFSPTFKLSFVAFYWLILTASQSRVILCVHVKELCSLYIHI